MLDMQKVETVAKYEKLVERNSEKDPDAAEEMQSTKHGLPSSKN